MSKDTDLCEVCRGFNSNQNFPHHNLKDLRLAAKHGCPCCQLIAGTLNGVTQSPIVKRFLDAEARFIEENPGQPFYYYLAVKETGLEGLSSREFEQLRSQALTSDSKERFRPRKSSIVRNGNGVVYTVLDCEVPKTVSLEKLERRLEICQAAGQPRTDRRESYQGRRLGDSHSSDNVFLLISSWISDCTSQHRRCRQVSTPLPTRVLDVSGETLVLLESCGTHANYILLSHCWGRKKALTTTKETLNEMHQGIPVENLPKTFRDAVSITRRLGIQYLWIDSLCIVQNSPEDWAAESTKMHDYYKNGYLTISALFSTNSQCGILNSRQVSQALIDSKRNLYLRESLPEQREVLRTAPLNSRAWVMQERLLATRILHYSRNEVFWECQTCSAREGSFIQSTEMADPDSIVTSEPVDFKRLLIDLDKDKYSLKAGAFATWCRLVTQYTRCALTYSSDKLPAISGIASAIERETGGTYIAGIWKEDLRSLLWMVDDDGSLNGQRLVYGVTVDTAACWSWASGSKADRLHLSAVATDLFLGDQSYGGSQDVFMGPTFLVRVLHRTQPDSRQTGLNRGIGSGFMDPGKTWYGHETNRGVPRPHIAACKGLWITNIVNKLLAENEFTRRVERQLGPRALILCCLLVVPSEGDQGTWRRVGVGVIRAGAVKIDDWSQMEDFVLV